MPKAPGNTQRQGQRQGTRHQTSTAAVFDRLYAARCKSAPVDMPAHSASSPVETPSTSPPQPKFKGAATAQSQYQKHVLVAPPQIPDDIPIMDLIALALWKAKLKVSFHSPFLV